MSDAVLDANVLVALIDALDVHHARAERLVQSLQDRSERAVLLDVLVSETVSVLCRRCREKKRLDVLPKLLAALESGFPPGVITWVGGDIERSFGDILAVVRETDGSLNFNDAFLVVLQRKGIIGPVATFDEAFSRVPGFLRIAEP
jgi:predicted nucleic acid-binding protein